MSMPEDLIEKYEYMFQAWGGFYNPEFKAIHGREPGYFYFDTKDEREAAITELMALEQLYNARVLMITRYEGTNVRPHTIAVMKFLYQGTTYEFEYNFGAAYPEESALYMFEEGNYACDCNRAMFLSEKYPEKFNRDQPCGDAIDMISIQIEFRKPNEKQP